MILKTHGAASEIGVNYWTLFNMVRMGRIPAPEKDSSGDYVWSVADLRRAREVLERRRSKVTPK